MTDANAGRSRRPSRIADYGSRAVELMRRRPETSILAVTILAVLYFTYTAPGFATVRGLGSTVTFIAATGIMAAGLSILMISGEIDLSAGVVFASCPIFVVVVNDAGLPLLVAVTIALVAAGLVGVINGLITTVVGVSSFIVTLGTFFALNGMNLLISGGAPSSTPGSGIYAQVMGGWKYSSILFAIAITILLQFVLSKTRWGSHVIAVGTNALASSEAGIRVRWVKMRAFVLCAVLAGFAGILESVRVTSTDALAGGPQLIFLAVSAVVIGGTLLTGGRGTVIGAFIGATFLGVVRSGFTLGGISAYAFDLIVGIAILVAMTINVALARLNERAR